jgi:hypothetical protein
MKTVNLVSKFNRCGILVQFDAELNSTILARSYDQTWSDDSDTSCEIEIPDDFIGARISSSDIGYDIVEWFGFSDELLESTAPFPYWFQNWGANRTVEWKRRTDMAGYIAGKFPGFETRIRTDQEMLDRGITEISPSGEVLVTVPYSWGDQSSAHYAVFLDGEFLRQEKGVGETTPEPVINRNGGWSFTDARIRHAEYENEVNREVNEMIGTARRRKWGSRRLGAQLEWYLTKRRFGMYTVQPITLRIY